MQQKQTKKKDFLLLVDSRNSGIRSGRQNWAALMALVVIARPDRTMKSRLFAPKAP